MMCPYRNWTVKWGAIFGLCFHLVALNAQTGAPQPLDWPVFRSQVLLSHPVVRQADLQYEQAEAGLLRAWGGFDPKTYADFYGKNFNDKNYFRYAEAGLKWPTWMGLELKGAYSRTGGIYLNPEAQLPQNGQVSAGFNWTLGQGLLIDDRRAALAQARIDREAADAARAALRNDLLLAAAKAYWTWVVAANQLRLYEASLEQAQLRLEALRESVVQGDKPAIDTVETLLQVQTRQVDVNFARLDLRNAALEMANFWWTDALVPLPADQLPPAPDLLAAEGFVPLAPGRSESARQQAVTTHPEIRLYDFKLRRLNVERRLKNEKRKPVLDLSYQLLGNGWQFFPTPAPEGGLGILGSDVKYGVSFSYPLLNRKARGDWQLTRIKIRDTELALTQKRRELETKVGQYANEVDNYAAQIAVFQNATLNYRRLLDAELEKFRFGESSIFLINTREQRWLDAQIKYLKLLGEYRKAEASLLWSAGISEF